MKNVLEYLEESAQKYPFKIAVADAKRELNYSELLIKASNIGSTILENDISNQSSVVIYMEKSVEALCAMLGTVYAGCFYTVFDKKMPENRLLSMLETLETKAIIASKDDIENDIFLKEASKKHDIKLIEYVEKDKIKIEGNKFELGIRNNKINLTKAVNSLNEIRLKQVDTDILYVNFTSGSTGVPKGVAVSHRSVIDFMNYFPDIFDINENDIIGNQAPLDFDVSVKDIYSALKVGAKIQLIPKNYFSNPTILLDYLCENKVTTLIWAVSALCMLTTFHGFDYKIPGDVNKVLFSGEVMPIKHLIQWQEALSDALFVNLYGPTEITCNCTYHIINKKVESGDIIPIGIPFPNEKVFLLDENDKLITQNNVEGEICVSGSCLAIGYYNNEEQNEKAFVFNPVQKAYKEKMYRTGDLAYKNSDGNFVFASRKDFQIKHMGHRIELSEIEYALDKIEGCERSCVIFNQEKNKIVCFYRGTIDKKDLKISLKKIIPEYMVPNRFYKIEDWPLNKNGKTDRKELEKLYL